jgi:hypothetical protein
LIKVYLLSGQYGPQELSKMLPDIYLRGFLPPEFHNTEGVRAADGR